jgi:CO/xanthine dehydrogenase FAD-binding subunit
LADAIPLRHNAYKISLAKRLIRRALLTLADLALDEQGQG